MSSETDPLLPRGNTAPEISGYGFSKSSQSQYQIQNEVLDYPEDIENKSEQKTRLSYGDISPLRTLLVIFIIVVGLAMFVSLLIPDAFNPPWNKAPEDDDMTVKARVDKILAETPLIDGHNDLAFLIRYAFQNNIYDKNFTDKWEGGGMPAQVDLPRLKDGRVGGAFWSAFVLCPKNGTDFSDGNYAEAVSTTLSQLDLLRRLTVAYPKVFSSSNIDSSSALAAFKDHHQLISPIGIEGLHQIGNSFSNLRLYYSLGVKYATLTWNCHNAFADAALTTDSSGRTVAGHVYWRGLSKAGRVMITEMNRLGMLVDLSHVSKDTMLDVLGARPEKGNGSIAPVIFSHSSAYALCPHPRNVQDDVLKLVKKTNSIVMVNFSPDFISCLPSDSETGIPDFYPPNATLHQVARHVTYIGDLIGYDHVGLGSDFDGIPKTPEGLDDVSKYPDLVAELLKMGVSDVDAAKVVGLNILRVWGEAEKQATKMQGHGVLPAQDFVEKISFP
ncbi:hypothetical protein HO133_008799 [Letharia lupina]|uniref:Dipeptidase n=1 Tax=Letharia lupina TaxID=560253 RepID=A0A8H6CPA0_9LECA|nr:uncharacterized protein HO133_008799 [Letharia lupina]KAF6227355.1 hypothetical protein HO133_008799 [Letharia lupina]